MTRRRGRSAAPWAALVALLLALTACTSLPEEGPVVEADVVTSMDDELPSDIDVVPPAQDASAVEVVGGFLDAMTASPIRIDIAKQYLSEQAAAAWDPEASTITYVDNLPPRDVADQVRVQLAGADLLDRSGAFRGTLPSRRQELRFNIAIERGQYRITNPPNALVVPASWFAQRYRRVSLYFFDTSARILVPEPVFVPTGQQLATSLIAGLVNGPGSGLDGVARSFLPSDLAVGLSVPISTDGVADIDLLGDADALTAEGTARMFAQLAWTLRQDPSVRAFRVRLGGENLVGPEGGTTQSVTGSYEYDPTGEDASPLLYGLRKGLLVSGSADGFVAASGPFAVQDYGLDSVAVDLDATTAAGVADDGRSLLTAPMARDSQDTGQGPGQDAGQNTGQEPGGKPDGVTTVIDDATDLLPPVWDFSGRLWTIDRTAEGAVVRYAVGRTTRTVRVPGVTGRDVVAFLVSRDSTRFVAVVRGDTTDELRVGRVSVADSGVVARVTPTVVLSGGERDRLRIRDVAWTSPTTLALVTPVRSDGRAEVRTVSVDGASSSGESLETTVAGPVVGLAGDPQPEQTQYAVTRTGLTDLDTGVESPFVGGAVTSLDHVG